MIQTGEYFTVSESLGKKIFIDKKRVILFLITLAVSAGLLISVNYYSIKLLSALRAGIYGQTVYEKSQIEETRNIAMYIQTGDTAYLHQFNSSFTTHLDFFRARILLSTRAPEPVTTLMLMRCGINAADVNDIWFLVHTMRNLMFMQKTMGTWKKEDLEIARTQKFIEALTFRLKSGKLSSMEMLDQNRQFYRITMGNAMLKSTFSSILSDAARTLNMLVFYFNVISIVLIMGLMTFISSLLLKRIRVSGKELYRNNLVLQRKNFELDKFIYSTTHDLRSPVSSLQGLIDIVESEAPQSITPYLVMMRECIWKQDRFIKEIINYSANQAVNLSLSHINLLELLNEVIDLNQLHFNAIPVKITTDIRISEIFSDRERLKIILISTLGNAIHYRKTGTEHCLIHLSACMRAENVELTITDFGTGIKEENIPHVFDMFFVTDHINRGSGVGLYNVRETIEKMNGSITVTSVYGKETSFIILLPQQKTSQV